MLIVIGHAVRHLSVWLGHDIDRGGYVLSFHLVETRSRFVVGGASPFGWVVGEVHGGCCKGNA